jgi:hypothetical protein
VKAFYYKENRRKRIIYFFMAQTFTLKLVIIQALYDKRKIEEKKKTWA